MIFKFTYQHCSDEELMQYVSKGSRRAFGVLYDRYHVLMYRFFYRMLWQNTHTARDFTHDLFLKIIEKPLAFDTSKVFRAWIYTLANNMCKNAYRDKKTTEDIDNQIIEYSENIDLDLDFVLYEAQLQVAIANLDDKHRTCFVLRYFEDLSVKEIADIESVAEGTVKSRLHYATKKLATELAFLKEIF